jgi:RNAse (barnase) inhibitor barstar
MNDRSLAFWKTHLEGVTNPLIHFVNGEFLDLKSVERAVNELGFSLFVIDARNIKSEADLMDALAESMALPKYFGRGWNAALDLMRDISWKPAPGYVLVIFNGSNLPTLEHQFFATLISVLEATVRDWRDERGEYSERTAAVPFHAILSDGESLRSSLLAEVREPVCEHIDRWSVGSVRKPERLTKTATYQDAAKLLGVGADSELVLAFLRERGMSRIDSIYAISALTGEPVSSSKILVDNSQTWSNRYDSDTAFRNAAREALRDLGWE